MPKVTSFNKLYDVCKQYGQEYNIMFNPHKNKLVVYGSNIEDCTIDNNFVISQPSEKHIRHVVGPQSIDRELNCKTSKLIVNTNHILSLFKHASFEIKYKLFKAYSMPLYGCLLWDHSSQELWRNYMLLGENVSEKF